MKVIVYNISQQDKKLLALSNRKKHKITIIVYPLDEATVHFAESKDVAIIIGQENLLSNNLILKLISIGIRYFIFTSHQQLPIDLSIIKDSGLQYLCENTVYSKLATSHIIDVLDAWEKK